MFIFHIVRKSHRIRMEDLTSDMVIERLRKVRALQPERSSGYRIPKGDRITHRLDRG